MSSKDMKMDKLKALLDETHDWPCEYMFKFIIPLDQIDTLKDVFKGEDIARIEERPSKKGNYLGATFVVKMSSGQAVLDIYDKTKEIKGLMAL